MNRKKEEASEGNNELKVKGRKKKILPPGNHSNFSICAAEASTTSRKSRKKRVLLGKRKYYLQEIIPILVYVLPKRALLPGNQGRKEYYWMLVMSDVKSPGELIEA